MISDLLFLSFVCCRWSDCIDTNSDLFDAFVDSFLSLISTFKSQWHNLQHYQVDQLEKVIVTTHVVYKTP